MACVVVPTSIAVLYFGAIASDVYISESSFLIRAPEKQGSSILGQFLKGTGFSNSQDDVYAVEDYIKSRDAMNVLARDLNLKQKFASGKVDIFNRFNGMGWDSSYERFYKYYQKMVGIQIGSMSSILTLQTKAFTAQDSRAMNAVLLTLGEKLVNSLNQRAQESLISTAQGEIDKAESKAKKASLALAEYRNRNSVIDPEKQSAIPLQQIAALQDQLMSTNALILQIATVSKDNPQLTTLRQHAQLLAAEIDKETTKVAGSGKNSLASKSAGYQRLLIDNQFADRALVSAMASLEQARNEAQHQQLFLERISQPSLPDRSMEPKRLQGIAAVLLLGMLVWGILSILLAGVREHHDR